MTIVLQPLAQEQLTINGTASGITATKFDNSAGDGLLNIVEGIFTVVSGGNFYHSALATPSNSGANGEHFQKAGQVYVVRGLKELLAWLGIKASGASDATVQVTLYGTP